MKNKLFRFLCLALSVCLMLTLFAGCGEEKKTARRPYVVGATSNVDSGKVAENDSFTLEWDAETANVMITDKQSGYVYSQIPYEYYKQNRDRLKIEQNEFLPGMEIPEVESGGVAPLYSPIYITALTVSNNVTTTLYANTEVFVRGRVGSKEIENGIRVTYYFDAQMISVPVEYTLTDSGFSVQVVPTDITESSDENKILTVSLSPMLCSVSAKRENYLVVPSGSGALMYADERGSGAVRTFSGEVYGADPAVEIYEKLSNTEEVRLPVFGAVEGERAVAAIIENGSEKCVINAQAGNKNTSYASAYVTCYVRGYNRPVSTILAGRIRIRTHIKEELVANEPITVSYHIMNKQDASYSGIASYYRDWLIENRDMSDKAESRLLYTTLLGGFQTNELMLGIPYKKTVSLTTYEQAEDIAKQLCELSGSNMVLNMSGFGATGVSYGDLGGGFKLTGVNGSKKDIKNLLSKTEELGIDTYFNFDVIRFKKGAGGLKDTAVTANNAASKQYVYNRSTKLRELDDYHFLLQRSLVEKSAEKALSAAEKLGITGISLDSLGSVAYSDYVDEKFYNKEGTQEQVSEILKNIKSDGEKVALSEANEFAAVLADVVLNVPTASNQNLSFDEEIPFYQMVFKGCVDIAGEAINTATNSRTQFLKSVESGMGLSFQLTADYSVDTTLVGEDVFFATKFDDNKQTISEMIKESKEYLSEVKSAKIADHKNITATLTKTVFDNGVTVYVNYGDKAVSTAGVKIPATDFVALKGGTVIE